MMRDDEFFPDEPPSSGRSVPDLFRKLLLSSVGALFMTEEGIRSLVKELKVPKELIGYVIAQADRTKTEVVRVMAGELRTFLESAKVRDDLVQLLGQLTFEVNAEVKVRPRKEGESGITPRIRTTVERPRPKRKEAPKKRKGRA